MITLASFTCFLAFYACYLTSGYSEPVKFRAGRWLQRNPGASKSLGLSLFAASCTLLVLSLGVGAGIITFLILLSTIGGLVIILNPLKVINYQDVAVLFMLFLLFETIKL